MYKPLTEEATIDLKKIDDLIDLTESDFELNATDLQAVLHAALLKIKWAEQAIFELGDAVSSQGREQ